MSDYERIERVILYVGEHYREQPSLRTLARVAGVSESHFHRLFSRWAGTTPKSFVKFVTAAHARDLLRQSKDLLDVSFEAGLSGPGRLHDLVVSVEGMTPGELKSGGAGVVVRFGFHSTPFGRCIIGLTERGICHLAFVGAGEETEALAELQSRWPHAEIVHDTRATASAVTNVFARRAKRRVSVLLSGTPFQLEVWQALLRIPTGCATTYEDVARAIGRPHAARAVGSAVGRNNVAYLIPCHRVIRQTGIIGPYRWGHARKKAILAWENATARDVAEGYDSAASTSSAARSPASIAPSK